MTESHRPCVNSLDDFPSKFSGCRDSAILKLTVLSFRVRSPSIPIASRKRGYDGLIGRGETSRFGVRFQVIRRLFSALFGVSYRERRR